MLLISLIARINVEGVESKPLHLVNDPNPSYAHDHMVLLESERNFSMFIWVQTSMVFILI